MVDWWIAAVLGIVEGVTEFLPVSSTGHLILVGNLLGFSGEKAACFDVFIQLGAIFAVVCLYYYRFVGLIPVQGFSGFARQGFSGIRGLTLLAVTTLPALLIGAFAHKAIKQYLFGPMTVVWALGIGGIAIILVEKFKPESSVEELDGLSCKQALAIGLFQILAMWPGVSRSAATIVGGMLSGLNRKVAAEYSFLAAVPVMVAATGYDLYKEWRFLSVSDIGFFAVGFVVSFVSAALAVKTFISLVQRWSLAPYAWYRIAVACVVYLMLVSH
ncbi:MAG: undecaprenyl-diphosphate phosphatase [Desulfomonile tiedjei]|uniref:Undecaprenyl-diphosphatase n=1 Tax=Desulfomonile tiedjei TaxID=2358 RepID=A0A9D6V2E6_9BACT|nr:undecaprenyl-diphosphate phosphatase [Desulfomonile tiedjei]